MMLARSWHGGWNSRGRGASHSGAGCSLLLQHGPVERVVVLVVQGAEEDPKNVASYYLAAVLVELSQPT